MNREATRIGTRALPRWLHPGAWWMWALGLATAASRTTNPALLLLICAVAALVVNARKPEAPWARSFGFFVRLGILVIAIRVFVQVLFGANIGHLVLVPLPGVTLPEWMAGVRLGGDVMVESVLAALYDGMRLATILICVGAANSLASPTRLLKSVPAALYEIGVSVVVALTFTPQLVADVSRVRTARHLRGRSTTGVRAIAGASLPVLESALERSVSLAAAMDSRGYGRRNSASDQARRTSGALLLVGLVAACIGVYGLVAAGTPLVLQLPMLLLGLGSCAVALAVSARTVVRSRYRPDPWWAPEWLVALSGAVAAIAFIFTGMRWPGSLVTAVDPPVWPTLPTVALIGLALALLPAIVAPRLPMARPTAMTVREAVAA